VRANRRHDAPPLGATNRLTPAGLESGAREQPLHEGTQLGIAAAGRVEKSWALRRRQLEKPLENTVCRSEVGV
jgi:hypothetical protein